MCLYLSSHVLLSMFCVHLYANQDFTRLTDSKLSQFVKSLRSNYRFNEWLYFFKEENIWSKTFIQFGIAVFLFNLVSGWFNLVSYIHTFSLETLQNIETQKIECFIDIYYLFVVFFCTLNGPLWRSIVSCNKDWVRKYSKHFLQKNICRFVKWNFQWSNQIIFFFIPSPQRSYFPFQV